MKLERCYDKSYIGKRPVDEIWYIIKNEVFHDEKSSRVYVKDVEKGTPLTNMLIWTLIASNHCIFW